MFYDFQNKTKIRRIEFSYQFVGQCPGFPVPVQAVLYNEKCQKESS